MSEENTQTAPSETSDTSDSGEAERHPHGEPAGWEWWVRVAILLLVAAGVAWGIVFARLGLTSVRAHAFAVPVIGGLTLPVIFWGVMKTVFNPPLVQKPRLVGFACLLFVGVFNNVPLFPAPVSTADWQSEHTYRLPFDGAWYTLAGGSDMERNYHVTTAPWRWAYDFAPRKDGSRFEGDGDELSDYYCFGEPVLASAGGRVVKLEDEKKDKPPQEFDQYSVMGNHVVIKVGEEEFVWVGHLKEGSVPVEVGQTVEPGEVIGKCGNSGRAVEPHVHVHLQSSTKFPVAEGLPLRFSNYRVGGQDGELVDKGMPQGAGEGDSPKGQIVSPVTRPAPPR